MLSRSLPSSVPVSLNPDVQIWTFRAFAVTQSSSTLGTTAAGTVMTTRSNRSGTEITSGYVFAPSISRVFGLIGYRFPAYPEVLRLRKSFSPEYPGARHNRQRVQELIDEINRLSESQQAEPGVSGEDKELGTDDAIPAEGAEELSWAQAKTVKLTAEQILEDPATGEMWLRSVQQDPSNFLAIKFGMQLQREEEPR